MGASRLIVRGLAVFLAVALLAFLTEACNGGGGGGNDTPEADGDDGGDDGALQDLAALAGQAAEGVTARVTYKITTEADGETVEGEWVVVQRPPDSRVEFFSAEGGEEILTIVIIAGGKTYLCSSRGGEQSCLATETEGAEAQTALLTPLFALPREITEDVGGLGLVNKLEREIAGLNATCFTVSSVLAGLGEGEVCFSDEGLLLFLQGEADGPNSTFEATSVSTDVTDADFEPPYEIETFELPEFDIPTPP